MKGSGVAHLSALFAVEARPVENHGASFPCIEMLHEVPAIPDRTDVGGVGRPFELVRIMSGVYPERRQFGESIRRNHQDMIGFIAA